MQCDSPGKKILVINIGNTSTKVAVFGGEFSLFEENIPFHPERPYPNLAAEIPERAAAVRGFIERSGVSIEDVKIIASRGGILSPLPAGVTRVNERMLGDLRDCKFGAHASNLSARMRKGAIPSTLPLGRHGSRRV